MTTSPEVEEGVLAVAMHSPEAAAYIFDRMKQQDFADLGNRCLYIAIYGEFLKGGAIEPTLIVDRLRKTGELEVVGGASKILSVHGLAVSVNDYKRMVAFLIEVSSWRRLGDVHRRMGEMLNDCEQSDAIIGETLGLLTNQISRDNPYLSTPAIIDFLEWQTSNEYRRLNPDKFASWPWRSARELFGPFRAGEFIVIGGQTHSGKSQVATQCAAWQAGNEIPIGYFSLEMRRSQVGGRLLRAARQYFGDEADAIMHDLTRFPAFVDDRAKSIEEICGRIRVLHAVKHIEVAYIDHIGLVQYTDDKRTRSRADEIGYITKRLLALAQELQIDIVALCQYNRDDVRLKARPTTASLRDSGHIEADADVIVLLSKPHEWDVAHEYTADLTLKDGSGNLVEWGVALDFKKDRDQGRCQLLELRHSTADGLLHEVGVAE